MFCGFSFGIWRFFGVWCLGFGVFLDHSASAQIFGYDDAGNYRQSANWTNASNQGFGFSPWSMSASGPSFHGWYLNNGYAIRSVTNVGGVDFPNCSLGTSANGAV